MIDVKKRYEVNPYTNDVEINLKKQKVKVSSNKITEEVWINQYTGQELETNVYTYREVEDAQFIKIFTQNIALAFNLTSPGIKALSVLIFEVQRSAIKSDIVVLDEITLHAFLEKNTQLKLSMTTLYAGVKELLQAQILARHKRLSHYYINPNFVFNGDRTTFINTIKRKPNKLVQHNQLSLLDNE